MTDNSNSPPPGACNTGRRDRCVIDCQLALRPKDAAKALGIGERLLWSKTNAGEIPCVRIGRAVVYPMDLLREYLRGQAEGGKRS